MLILRNSHIASSEFEMCLPDLSPYPAPLSTSPALSMEWLKNAYCTRTSKVSLSLLRSSLTSFSTSASLERQQSQQLPSPSSTLTAVCSYSQHSCPTWCRNPTRRQREQLPMAANPIDPQRHPQQILSQLAHSPH